MMNKQDDFFGSENFDNVYSVGEIDKLERKDFIKHVCLNIWRSLECSGDAEEKNKVFAICADWGDGKTFIKKKMISLLSHLGKNEERRLEVKILDFNPWQNASEGNVDKYFLNELEKLTLYLKNNEGLEATSVIKLPSLDKVSFDFKSLIELPLVIGIVSIAFSFLTLNQNIFNKVNGADLFVFVFAFFSITAVCIKYNDLLSSFADYRTSLKRSSREIIEIKNDIISFFNANKEKYLLVFIDDIDRLSSKQIIDVFKNVQQNENIPNVSFVLFYKKDYVHSAYKELCHIDEKKFIDKIVQVEFIVPDIPIYILNSIIDEKTTEIFENFSTAKYYHELMSHRFVLIAALRNIRGVNRFFSSVANQKMNISSYDNSDFEYWVPDFILIECLKFIDLEVFDLVKKNLYLILGDYSFHDAGYSYRSKSSISIMRFQSLIRTKLANSSFHNEVSYILTKCFANLRDTIGNEQLVEYKVANEGESNRNRRVDSVKYGYNYFSSSYRRKVIDQKKVLSIIKESILNNRSLDFFRRSVIGNGITLKDYFEELRIVFNSQEVESIDPNLLLCAFVNNSLAQNTGDEMGLSDFKDLNYSFINTILLSVNDTSTRYNCIYQMQKMIVESTSFKSFVLYPLMMRVFSHFREDLKDEMGHLYIIKFKQFYELEEEKFLQILSSQAAESSSFLSAILSMVPFINLKERDDAVGMFLSKLVQHGVIDKVFNDEFLDDMKIGDLRWNELVIGQLEYLFRGQEHLLIQEIEKKLINRLENREKLEAILKSFKKRRG